jgi:hypothetical protein
MLEERHRCLVPSVVTLSWTDPEGTEQHDYAPLHEVWASGGQLHVEEAAPVGRKLRVTIEDGREITGVVQTCAPDESFGYIIDVIMHPKNIWLSGPYARHLAGEHEVKLLEAALSDYGELHDGWVRGYSGSRANLLKGARGT